MTTTRIAPLTRWLAAGGVALLALAGCTTTDHPAPPTSDLPPDLRLVAFDSCDDLTSGLRAAAKSVVGPYGLENPATLTAPGAERAPQAGSDAKNDAATAPGAAPATDSEHSTTNTHEAGVDEPDLVKTDGRRIVTVSNGVLRVVDPASRTITGTLQLPTTSVYNGYPSYDTAQQLLAGDRALVLTSGSPQPPPVGPAPDGPTWEGPPREQPAQAPATAPPGADGTPDAPVGPRLIAVDLSGTPHVTGEYTIDGQLVDARQAGTVARVVVRSAPRIDFPNPDTADPNARVELNRQIIDQAPVEDWLPRYRVDNGSEHRAGQVNCSAVSRPTRYTATSMLTVLTFDLGQATLGDGTPVSVVADGDTVYSTGTSLYVANYANRDLPDATDRTSTDLYKFDTTGSERPRFVAAGRVGGYLLNQYSLSEWNGSLRVATTSTAPWRAQTDQGSSESTVYVLRQQGATLTESGRVGGLGKGERIYAVRFLGEAGYVVTFRQTDPLYSLDLRDPSAPRMAGELKITGYSAYLHPAGDGRLIGIGQEASEQGRVQGTQVSLFDVADPAHPTRLAQYHAQWSNSEAEFEPHAFLYWPTTGLLVVPLSVGHGGDGGGDGALALRVGDTALTEVGTLSHPSTGGVPYSPAIRRSLVIGDTLWTVSDTGLAADNLGSLRRIAWLPYT